MTKKASCVAGKLREAMSFGTGKSVFKSHYKQCGLEQDVEVPCASVFFICKMAESRVYFKYCFE